MNTIDLTTVLRHRLGVRKRHLGSEIFLIRFTKIYKIDPICEQLWNLFDGKKTVYDISQVLIRSGLAPNEASALELVLQQAINLQNLHLLEEAEPDFGHYIESQLAQAQFCRLQQLMQQFYENEKSWFEGLQREDLERIVKRFYRILYEMYTSRFNGLPEHCLSESTFLVDLSQGYFIDDSTLIEKIRSQYELHVWSYDLAQNRMVIQYAETVYVGDLDNRL